MSDYWYENRDKLRPGLVVGLHDDSVVRLEERVEGDGTNWIVSDYNDEKGFFTYDNRRIHPGDIRLGPKW